MPPRTRRSLRRFLPNTGAETPSAIGEDGGVSEQRHDPLVAPTMHREQVVGDFDVEEHLAVQRVVHAAGRALTELIDTERLYVCSLGSQLGNRHVHRHLVPLPPGVPYDGNRPRH
jgi:hypothetical protein